MSELWTQTGFKLNEDVFKLSRFRQKCFIQEIIILQFVCHGSASRPYSKLKTSSRILVWDPGSTESAAQHSRRRWSILLQCVCTGMVNTYPKLPGNVPQILYSLHMLTTLGRGLLGQSKVIVEQLGTLLSCTTLCILS